MPKYQHLMIDPPWPNSKGGIRKVRPKQGKLLEYSTMSIEGIFQLLDSEIFPLAAAPHNVYLWCIDKFLVEAEVQMRARGYKLHARLVWSKLNGVAPAFTIRYSHEYLLWWYKPTLIPVAATTRGKFTTVMVEAARQHSRKPDIAYKLVEALYPNQTYFDVFSREFRANWDQFGDECGKYS